MKYAGLLAAAAVLALIAAAGRAVEVIHLANHPDLSPDGTTLVFDWDDDMTISGACRPLAASTARRRIMSFGRVQGRCRGEDVQLAKAIEVLQGRHAGLERVAAAAAAPGFGDIGERADQDGASARCVRDALIILSQTADVLTSAERQRIF